MLIHRVGASPQLLVPVVPLGDHHLLQTFIIFIHLAPTACYTAANVLPALADAICVIKPLLHQLVVVRLGRSSRCYLRFQFPILLLVKVLL
jgi:hypothetical protein